MINYLAEEKRLQEEQMKELRLNQADLEQQLDEARATGGANRLLNEELQDEVSSLRQQLELVGADLDAAREAQALAEGRLPQLEEERLALEARVAAAEAESRMLRAENEQLRQKAAQAASLPDTAPEVKALRAEVEEQKAYNKQLEEELSQARLRETYSLDAPADTWECESLRADLAAERHRVMELENRLRQMADRKDDTCSADQLWALCGKMERTIRQMERMLDGPYQVTCYPSEPFSDKTAERIFEEPAEEIREQSEYTAKPKAAVSSLLQRVRGK
ncbi:MAG: hypothetical protein IKY86_06045 [Clostridia bacterium]|nr:hypothetical protein [Clostridia bacterium]